MDTSEKVKVLKSFEELTQEITKDKEERDICALRYAVRFIMLNNFNEFQNLAKFMASIGTDSLDLEDLISSGEDDEWITKDTLKDAIKNCKKSTFVTPFSELVRFYNDDDFRGFFNEIMLLEDIHNPQKRIYIPLIGLQNRFTDFLNHFARIQESAPIWRYDAQSQSVEVYFAKYKDFVLPNEAVQCQLDSLRDWLKFWKSQAPQERIVCTSKPIAAKYKYSKPDNIFNFTKIANAHEFMTQFLGLSFPFQYQEVDNSNWDELLQHIDKQNLSAFSFEHFVKRYFNRVKFDASDVISEWVNTTTKDDFPRWLLKNYVQHTHFAESYPYVSLCLDNVTDLSDEYILINMIATRILYDLPSNKKSDYAIERRNIIIENKHLFEELLTQDDQLWLFDQIKHVFQQQNNFDFAIQLCTGVFDFEKKLLMGWSVYNPNNQKLKDAITEIYPEYAAYLTTNRPSHFSPDTYWVIDYINAYKQAKMEDKYVDEIYSFVKTKNSTSSTFYNWFYGFANSHDVLAEISNKDDLKPDKVYWIDGLGVEFLSYILQLIEEENSNLKVVRSQITRSELPSSTYHNRFEGNNVIKFGELDELGHNAHGYKQFDTLIEELSIIKSIIKNILGSCKKGKCTIAIVSDHGLSCLSRKAPSKKYDGKFEHEGRYIKTTEEAVHDTDYIIHKNDTDGLIYKVALTHSSLSKVPTHQVHGGCTPEEVLVPFIVLSNKDAASYISYQISIPNPDIMLSNPNVVVSIIPQPTKVTLSCEGRTYDMKKDGTSWTAAITGIGEGKHMVDVQPEGAESTQLPINVIGIGGDTNIDNLMDI